MTKQVIKSNGEKVNFDVKRIHRSITRAANDAKLTPEEINKLVNGISSTVVQILESKDKVKSSEIRDIVLAELDALAPKVSFEWRRFMNTKKK